MPTIATVAPWDPVHSLEQSLQLLAANRRTLVVHCDRHRIRGSASGDINGRACRSVLNGIANQIGECLKQSVAIPLPAQVADELGSDLAPGTGRANLGGDI